MEELDMITIEKGS